MDIRATDDERRALRLNVARRDIPEMLVWAGTLTLIFGVVNYFALADESAWAWSLNIVFGPLFLGLSWILRRSFVPDTAAPWVWGICSMVLVAMLINVFRLQPTPANLAYVAAAMTAFGPLTAAWQPYIASSVGMLVAAAIAFSTVPGITFSDTFLVCVAAVLISAILLRLRMNSLNAVADAQSLVDHQATSDPMTDTLNRNGLERALPALVATARRNGENVLVWFIDVRGLKQANDLYGHGFGDSIILSVTSALRETVRTNDVIARWGGDEFVVLGVGRLGSAHDLNVRIDAALQRDMVLIRRWPGAVTVGFARGSADADPHLLIVEADTDMYRRRIAT